MVCSLCLYFIFSFIIEGEIITCFFFLTQVTFLNLSFQCGKLLFLISISLADVRKLLETSREFHHLAPPQSLLSSVLGNIKVAQGEGRTLKVLLTSPSF